MSTSRHRHYFSEEQIMRARELRASGVSWSRIGARLGCAEETIRVRIDADYAAVRKSRYDGPLSLNRAGVGRLPVAEEEAALASIPSDTRGRLARWMGDPLPGRSALDARRARELNKNGESPVKKGLWLAPQMYGVFMEDRHLGAVD